MVKADPAAARSAQREQLRRAAALDHAKHPFPVLAAAPKRPAMVKADPAAARSAQREQLRRAAALDHAKHPFSTPPPAPTG
jgi:hypothetical protein